MKHTRRKPAEDNYKDPKHKVSTSPHTTTKGRGAKHQDLPIVPVVPVVDTNTMIRGWAFFNHTVTHWHRLSTSQKVVRLALAFALLGIAVEISTGIISSMLKQYGSDVSLADKISDIEQPSITETPSATDVIGSATHANTTAIQNQTDTAPVTSSSSAASLTSNSAALYSASTSSGETLTTHKQKETTIKHKAYSDVDKPYAVIAFTEENLVAKIQVLSQKPLSLIDQHNVAKKLAQRTLAYVSRYPERGYIREVLSQRSLRLHAQIPAANNPLPYAGVYQCCQHGYENILSIVDPLTIDSAEFKRMLFHESWHAYVAMTKHQGSFPLLQPSPASEKIAYAPFRNSAERVLYRKAFEDSDKRLEHLDQLLDQRDAGVLTEEAKQALQVFVDALQDYKPQRFGQLFVMPQCPRRQTDLASLGDGSRDSVPLKNNQRLPLFYDEFQEKNEGIWITGYFVKDMTDVVRAFVRDQIYIREFTKDGYRNRVNDEDTYMTERDALVAELPYSIQKFMYAELQETRSACGYVGMDMSSLSSNEEDIITLSRTL